MKKEESRNSHAEEPKCTWGKEIEHKLDTYTTKPPKNPLPTFGKHIQPRTRRTFQK
jgi:hypothetical protein